MYDIKKVAYDAVALDDSDIDYQMFYHLTQIKYCQKRKRFKKTLDVIVKCNQKNIPEQKQSSKEMFKETLDRLE